MADANIVGGLIGGALIGLAAVILLFCNGRIAGISGIFGGIFFAGDSREHMWRGIFLAGMISGALIYRFVAGALNVELQAGTPVLVIAGLLVGVGTRLGSGCTSGHGVCGLARRSPRSLVATATFMALGALTVFIVRHGIG